MCVSSVLPFILLGIIDRDGCYHCEAIATDRGQGGGEPEVVGDSEWETEGTREIGKLRGACWYLLAGWDGVG